MASQGQTHPCPAPACGREFASERSLNSHLVSNRNCKAWSDARALERARKRRRPNPSDNESAEDSDDSSSTSKSSSSSDNSSACPDSLSEISDDEIPNPYEDDDLDFDDGPPQQWLDEENMELGDEDGFPSDVSDVQDEDGSSADDSDLADESSSVHGSAQENDDDSHSSDTDGEASDDGFTRSYYKGAAKSYGTSTHLFTNIAEDDTYARERRRKPYYPFSSKGEWDFALALHRLGAPLAKVTELLKTRFVSVTHAYSVKKATN